MGLFCPSNQINVEMFWSYLGFLFQIASVSNTQFTILQGFLMAPFCASLWPAGNLCSLFFEERILKVEAV